MKAIFDYAKLKSNREKAASNIQTSVFFKEAAEDIIDRLNGLDKNFANILDIESREFGLSELLVQSYKSTAIPAVIPAEAGIQEKCIKNAFFNNKKNLIHAFAGMTQSSGGIEVATAFEVEELVLATSKFDLITFSLGLNWINDIQKFLFNVRNALKPDGIFIGNFVGGDSLKNLRKVFIQAEMEANTPHFQHVSPFIHFDHVTPLFQQAGFVEVIIDYENVQLTYDCPLDFIKVLKNIGESGALVSPACHYIPKKVYAILQNKTKTFTEQINVISFIASPNKNSIKLIG